ncbi:hypothetical protein [Vreelandella titanicae]|uniref:hypothetical protein n=1 Tax=Vreelandella titanicae TaxID=664683 RepID=UPI00382179F7
MNSDEKERLDKEWEDEKVSRAEMLELMLPLVLSSSNLIKSVNILGKALLESGDNELLVAGAKSLNLADDAMKELREFHVQFKRISGDEEQGSDRDGTEA